MPRKAAGRFVSPSVKFVIAEWSSRGDVHVFRSVRLNPEATVGRGSLRVAALDSSNSRGSKKFELRRAIGRIVRAWT